MIDVAVVNRHRQQFLMPEEPVGAISMSELRQMLAESAADTAAVAPEVVVTGIIGPLNGGDTEHDEQSLWVKGSAEFRLLDATDEHKADPNPDEHDHEHVHAEGGECEFCKRRKEAESPVIIRFLDEAGNPLACDARQLFPFVGREQILVQGTARLKAGSIVIHGSKLFIPQTAHSATEIADTANNKPSL